MVELLLLGLLLLVVVISPPLEVGVVSASILDLSFLSSLSAAARLLPRAETRFSSLGGIWENQWCR